MKAKINNLVQAKLKVYKHAAMCTTVNVKSHKSEVVQQKEKEKLKCMNLTINNKCD